MDLEVDSRRGTKHEARAALEKPGVFAVVFLDETGATIWAGPGEAASSETKPVHIERSEGESSDLFALRSAELLRGRLLPGGRGPDGSEPQRSSGAKGPRDRSVSVTLGPALLLQSYAVVAPGVTGDIAAWFGRLGVGPYVTLPLVRNSWTGTKNALTFTQYSLGLGGRFLTFQNYDESFELQALLRVGITRLALDRSTGPEAQRFAATANLLSVEPGIEGTFAVLDWLRLGGQALAGLDVPLNQPIPEDAAPKPPPKGKKPAGSQVGSVQRHLTVSAVAVVHF